MGVDEAIEGRFYNYSKPVGSASPPADSSELERLVKYSVSMLSIDPDQAKWILKDVNPDLSANYLVGALANPEQRDSASEILRYYGPSEVTVKPLVLALANPERRDAVIEIFKYYGPSDITVKPLVGWLDSPVRREAVSELIRYYGPSEVTVRPLVGALNSPDPECRDAASKLLIGYGKEGLKYIHEPHQSSDLYEPVMAVISAIESRIEKT